MDESTERDDEGTAATKVDAPARGHKLPERAATEPPPARLGHFQLLECLGTGGMGTVFSAYDLHLDRKVAIKILKSKSPERQQRMLREAQAMAKLSHPNVVTAYEVGTDDDGTVFIAMEYVAGKTITDWRAEATPTWREVVAVFVQAARGLAAAHEAGIVHRDFKPANVLVDARGQVRVVDFGIAQVRGMQMDDESVRVPKVEARELDTLTPPTPETPLTELGSIIGTPAYMSPEQFESALVDARSDQFSFCIALFEALFGKRPFTGHGRMLADHVRRGVMVPPDPKAGVPGWVTAIVLRGLATDPAKRFGSMTELGAALERDPHKRYRWIAGIGAALVATAGLALFVGSRLTGGDACEVSDDDLAGIWDGRVRAGIEHSFEATKVPYASSSAAAVEAVLDRYAAAWTAMRVESCRATARGDQSEHLQDLRTACLDRRRGELRALTAVLSETADAKTVEKAVFAAASLAPMTACADTTALLRGYEAGDPTLREQLARLRASRLVGRGEVLAPTRQLVADARAAHDLRALAEGLELQGAVEADVGDLESSERSLAEAMRRARELDDVDLLATATIDLVSTLAEGGISKSREALGVLRVVEALIADVHDPAIRIRMLLESGDEQLVLAHADLAEPIFARAIEEARKTLGDNHVLVFRLRSLDGSALSRIGKPREALEGLEALVASASQTLGPLHPVTVHAGLQRCSVHADVEDWPEAAACFPKALADANAVLGVTDRELLSFRESYAASLANIGRKDDARREYTAIIGAIPASAWKEKWFIAAGAAHALGELELEAGDPKAALEHCQQASAATETEHAGPATPTCIATALLALRDPVRALEVLEPLRERIDSTPDPARLGATRAMIGAWRFAYARASWLVRRQAAPARALATRARDELGPAHQAEIDAWLATVR